jgi:spermidine synthase
MKSNLRFVFALVMACFFVSGVAGLVYQIAWARYLALFLGHTSYAVVAVLVAFMGGLAIGNAALGRVADRVQRPLALYGWLEIAIALYAVIFPWYYQVCHDLYISIARQVGAGPALLAIKFGFSFMTILLPTTLMGATFPALTRFVTHSLAELRERVASLYFINSLGAVFGCLVADFWWIPSMGLELTIFAAAALNFVAGLIALAISRATVEGADTGTPPEANMSDEYFSLLDLKVATIAIGCSGFVAMLYEVAWTRLLALSLGSSTHAFSIMLITFISGIAVGAAIVARSKRLTSTMSSFGWAEVALAATVLLSMFTYELLPYWFTNIAALFARRPEAYPLFELAQGLVCFAVMFIPAICLGMTLPLASRIATAELAKTGKSVGTIFAVNTFGTVLGAAVTGLWLMPALGMATTFAIGVVLNGAVGALILCRGSLFPLRAAPIGAALIAAPLFVWGATALFDSSWQHSFIQGVWRNRPDLGSVANYRAAGQRFNIDYYKDGAGSTVTVMHPVNDPNYISLRVNGKTDASFGDIGTQLMVGHLPVLLHGKATNALIVGLGSGMTPGAILRHTNIQSVKVVEISPEVAEAAHYFTNFNDNVFANPRFHLIVEDAKSFLKATSQKFDIIVSEPSNPWMAGVASVFTLEYYQSCAERLTKGGVISCWVQVYETSDETLRTVIKTFTSVFPFTSIWRAQRGDLILIGSIEPPAFDEEHLVARLADPRIASDLQRGGLGDKFGFLSRQVTSPNNTAFLTRENTPVHSDYFPTLEYMAQVGFFVGGISLLYDVHDETKITRPQTLLGSYLKNHPLSDADFRSIATAILDDQFGDPAISFRLIQQWASMNTNSTLPLEMLERAGTTRPTPVAEEIRLLPKHAWLMEQGKRDIAALHFYERVLMRSYRIKRNVFYVPDSGPLQEVLGLLVERDPNNHRVFVLHLAELAWDRGDDTVAARFGIEGLNPDTAQTVPYQFTLDEQAPRQVLTDLIESSLRSGQLKQAQTFYKLATEKKFLTAGEFYFAPLDLACRKVAAAMEAGPANPAAK